MRKIGGVITTHEFLPLLQTYISNAKYGNFMVNYASRSLGRQVGNI